jgi:hypothetical protein
MQGCPSKYAVSEGSRFLIHFDQVPLLEACKQKVL